MKIKTIISTNRLLGCHYPQRIQSLILRNYLESRGLPNVLHLTSLLDDPDIIKREVLVDEGITIVVFFSMGQVNNLSVSDFEALVNFLAKSQTEIHFALEAEIFKSAKELIALRSNLNIVEKSNFRSIKYPEFKKAENKVVNVITKNHLSSKRDYQARAKDEKPEYAALAKKFDKDYWDGSRDTGYGGYVDDGRWREIAQKIINHYGLNDHSSILDIGCGKGFLLKELKSLLPNATIMGLEISKYAIDHSPSKITDCIVQGCASEVPFPDDSFDLVFSNMTLHNLYLPELFKALKEMERVSRNSCWLGVESYQDERQKWNLMRWQLTCECFFTPTEWQWIFSESGYRGDYELIYFD